ncbi:hypothetical protein EG68_04538, partial [Paragonimus skrjabini miyazakii]
PYPQIAKPVGLERKSPAPVNRKQHKLGSVVSTYTQLHQKSTRDRTTRQQIESSELTVKNFRRLQSPLHQRWGGEAVTLKNSHTDHNWCDHYLEPTRPTLTIGNERSATESRRIIDMPLRRTPVPADKQEKIRIVDASYDCHVSGKSQSRSHTGLEHISSRTSPNRCLRPERSSTVLGTKKTHRTEQPLPQCKEESMYYNAVSGGNQNLFRCRSSVAGDLTTESSQRRTIEPGRGLEPIRWYHISRKKDEYLTKDRRTPVGEFVNEGAVTNFAQKSLTPVPNGLTDYDNYNVTSSALPSRCTHPIQPSELSYAEHFRRHKSPVMQQQSVAPSRTPQPPKDQYKYAVEPTSRRFPSAPINTTTSMFNPTQRPSPSPIPVSQLSTSALKIASFGNDATYPRFTPPPPPNQPSLLHNQLTETSGQFLHEYQTRARLPGRSVSVGKTSYEQMADEGTCYRSYTTSSFHDQKPMYNKPNEYDTFQERYVPLPNETDWAANRSSKVFREFAEKPHPKSTFNENNSITSSYQLQPPAGAYHISCLQSMTDKHGTRCVHSVQHHTKSEAPKSCLKSGHANKSVKIVEYPLRSSNILFGHRPRPVGLPTKTTSTGISSNTFGHHVPSQTGMVTRKFRPSALDKQTTQIKF